MSELYFYAAVCTDVGNNRKNNEDNFCLLGQYLEPEFYFGRRKLRSVLTQSGVIAVFDGMGGESCGEEASLLAARCAAERQGALAELSESALTAFAREANKRVCERMNQRRASMGSTLALVSIADGNCIAGNVGDSRVYLMREGKLSRLSEDHTVAEELVRMNMLSPEDAAVDKRRHQLTQHLGIHETEMKIQPHITGPFELLAGDKFLICSDGVTDALSDSALCTLLDQETTCEKMAGGIVESAMLAGSADNVTALVAKVGKKRTGGGEKDETKREKKKAGRGLRAVLWAVSAVLAVALGAAAAILR